MASGLPMVDLDWPPHVSTPFRQPPEISCWATLKIGLEPGGSLGLTVAAIVLAALPQL
jgi:hypothetical protein